jgi:Putative zinc finger in N-recognin (UBR box)
MISAHIRMLLWSYGLPTHVDIELSNVNGCDTVASIVERALASDEAGQVSSASLVFLGRKVNDTSQTLLDCGVPMKSPLRLVLLAHDQDDNDHDHDHDGDVLVALEAEAQSVANSGGGHGIVSNALLTSDQGTSRRRRLSAALFYEWFDAEHGAAAQDLVSMGFSLARARQALLVARFQKHVAIEWLLQRAYGNMPDALDETLLSGLVAPLGFDILEPVPQFVLDAIARRQCTFVGTGRNFTHQNWYRCHTCALVGGSGVCVSCARTCHRNHRLSSQSLGTSFYCDCGAEGNCRAMHPVERDDSSASSSTSS